LDRIAMNNADKILTFSTNSGKIAR